MFAGHPRATPVALPLLLFVATATAQVPSRGVLAGAPVAILVDGGLSPGADAETRVHRNGFSLAPTVAFPPASGAADLRAILALHGAPAALDVDDISTGRDDVLIDSNAFLQVTPLSWAVMSFSVTANAVGVPASGTSPASRIAQQVAEGDVGASLFSWILPGSTVPAALVGPNVVERSHSRRELGLPSPPTGALEVDGLDVPMILGLDQVSLTAIEPGFAPLLPAVPTIYFTVSHATRGLVPAAWWTFNGQPTLSSGATILRTQKFGASWTQPTVFQPYGLLGLQRDEDIDGLAYDGLRDKLLFSCVGTARDQFLFLDMIFDGPAVPQDTRLPDGTKVSQAIGKAQNDDVDAICTLDPRFNSLGLPIVSGEDFGSSCGTPQPGLLGTPAVHASAFRRRSGATTHYDTWMTGWPPITGQGAGFAAMFLTFGPALDLNLWSPVLLRNPANVTAGDPQEATIVVPPSVSLQNFDVTVRWIAADAALTELAEAWPVRLFL